MDSKEGMYLRRAQNELDAARILFKTSEDDNLKLDFNITPDSTFYSCAIAHAYYAIFFCAKAMLITKGIATGSPEVHRKTFDAWKKAFIDTGMLDARLFMIYKRIMIRAESLLEIYRFEKGKRGDFTYNTIPQTNISPAQESVRNAETFIRHCRAYQMNF